MGLLFGTDGIRGRANTYPITCDLALKAGQAIGSFAEENNHTAVIIGKDSRISGDMLESALAAGVASTGIDVLLAGVIPTPGVAYLCSATPHVGAGIVISASHNPYQDNGIKIFNPKGEKLSDEQESKIEHLILNTGIVPRSEIGKILVISDGLRKYADFLISKFPYGKLDKRLKLIIDCSNGAASKISHMVFNELLFDAQFIFDSPDGKNINQDCGSQHTKELQRQVILNKADIGLAFDGDADRLIVVDENGNELTGDRIVAVCAKFAHTKGKLKNKIVVSTIMSNVGLGMMFDGLGITHIKSDVGDRKVLDSMKKSGAVMGGEDSGHMIFLDAHTTGDGLLSALKLLEVMIETSEPLSRLASVMTVYPQVLKNVQLPASCPDLLENKLFVDTIKKIERALGDQGRVLIRKSGTQPLLRIMVEGPDQGLIETYCQLICDKADSILKAHFQEIRL